MMDPDSLDSGESSPVGACDLELPSDSDSFISTTGFDPLYDPYDDIKQNLATFSKVAESSQGSICSSTSANTSSVHAVVSVEQPPLRSILRSSVKRTPSYGSRYNHGCGSPAVQYVERKNSLSNVEVRFAKEISDHYEYRTDTYSDLDSPISNSGRDIINIPDDLAPAAEDFADGDSITSQFSERRDDTDFQPLLGTEYSPSLVAMASNNTNVSSSAERYVGVGAQYSYVYDGLVTSDDLHPRFFNKADGSSAVVVEPLREDEIRWFYRDNDRKIWFPFNGYDSLNIECQYRKMLNAQHAEDSMALSYGAKEVSAATDRDLIMVQGGLFDVDILTRKRFPAYWPGECTNILRGSWFYQSTWQPIDEHWAGAIDKEFLGNCSRICFRPESTSEAAANSGQHRTEAHSMELFGSRVVWYSVSEAYLQKSSASHKLYRQLKDRFGKVGGEKISRGYTCKAEFRDRSADVTHLVFVVHGIGHKMDSSGIVRSCDQLRVNCEALSKRYFDQMLAQNQRSEYLPVEWRSKIALDGESVEIITPTKLKGLRDILNNTGLDILYYTTPRYKAQIQQCLCEEMNRLYELFCSRNPNFRRKRHKVSVVAHSLGSVIVYDILNFDSESHSLEAINSALSSLIIENDSLKRHIQDIQDRVFDLKEKLLRESAAAGRHGGSLHVALKFKVENLFCIGSPLAVFLALRGVQQTGNIADLLPSFCAKRIYNIYHPSDPVAYRLEPLILKHYAGVFPLTIHRYDSAHIPYHRMKPYTYSTLVHGKSDPKSRHRSASDSKTASTSLHKFSIASRLLSKFSRQKDSEPSETHSTDSFEISSGASSDQYPSVFDFCTLGQPELEYRIDYSLRGSGGLANSYIQALTAHTTYWSNNDVAMFLLQHLHPDFAVWIEKSDTRKSKKETEVKTIRTT